MALFRGSKAPFLRARSRRRSIATRQYARCYVCGVRLHRAASGPENRPGSAIFHRRGHGPTRASSDRRADGGVVDTWVGDRESALGFPTSWRFVRHGIHE
jgi:hypothetical protein